MNLRRLLFLLVLIAISMPASAQDYLVYTHRNPDFEVTVPAEYETLPDHAPGASTSYMMFGKNQQGGFSDVVIMIDEAESHVADNVTTPPKLITFDPQMSFNVISSGITQWNNTNVATYVVEAREIQFNREPSEPFVCHLALLPVRPGKGLRVAVFGGYEFQNDIRETMRQVVYSLKAAGPAAQPALPGEEDAAISFKPFLIILPLLVVAAAVAGFVIILRKRQSTEPEPAPAYTPPPNAYRDLNPSSAEARKPVSRPDVPPWER